MRLHRNLVFGVIDALNFIFNENEYADKVVEKVLKYDKRWGARDRAFIAETTYDIVRWKRLYTEIAEVKAPFNRPDLFRIWAVWAVLRGIELPDWKQIEPTPTRRIKGKFDELSKIRKFRESVPDWLDELGEEALGEARDLTTRWAELPDTEKRQIVEAITDRIVIGRDDVEIMLLHLPDAETRVAKATRPHGFMAAISWNRAG